MLSQQVLLEFHKSTNLLLTDSTVTPVYSMILGVDVILDTDRTIINSVEDPG